MNKYKAHSRAKEFRACLLKKAYQDPHEAADRNSRIYKCHFCGWWHRASLVKHAPPKPRPKRCDRVNRKARR